MSKIIEVKNLDYNVGKKKILKDLSFSVDSLSIVSVIGNNASGKTTLLKLLAGIIPSKDSIIVGYGYINTKKSQEDVKKLGCVFGDYFPFLFDDVYKELVFPLENLCYLEEEVKTTVKKLVDYFDVSYILDKKITDLREEEKALVRILIALIHNPQVLIMDNPFLNMSRDFRENFMKKLVSYLKENKITCVFSTTNLEDILVTDYTLVLHDGEIVIEGDTSSVLKEDVRLKKLGLELPFMVDLSLMLQFYEILDDIYLDVEGLVNKLWK